MAHIQITKLTIEINKEGYVEHEKELTLEDCDIWVEDCYGERIYKQRFGQATCFAPRPMESIKCYTFCYEADIEKSKQAVIDMAKKAFGELEDKYLALEKIMSKIV